MLKVPCQASIRHGRTAVRLGVSSLSAYTTSKRQEKMTSESMNIDINDPSRTRNSTSQSRHNQRMLDLRQQVELQERIIRNLLSEKDSLTKELDSRLFLVEAQLRREQKHIEQVLTEKEQLIQFQAMQIESLKQLLSQTPRNLHSSTKHTLSKRYSVALEEYMKDHCIVSRAFPVRVQTENEKESDSHRVCSRTRSLPELRFKEIVAQRRGCCHGVYQQGDEYSGIYHSPKDFYADNIDTACQECCRILTQEVLDEIANRRWSSDCDSEHSDSLDSGISSPSIQTRSVHDYFESSMPQDVYVGCQKGLYSSVRGRANSSSAEGLQNTANDVRGPICHKPRRSSSLGNFIQRTFSSSEKSKEGTENRRHSSFSSTERKNIEITNDHPPRKDKFISSANRTFGTNHRSVTKPRDVKFRKLFKFRRRAEEPTGEDYMTV